MITNKSSIETDRERWNQVGARQPPGPKGLPFLGNLLDFGRDVLGYYCEWAQQYGDIVALRLGTWPALLLNHSDYVEHVLVKNPRNFIKFPFFFRHVGAIFGQGLLTSEGELWQRQRRLMAPAFHAQRLAGYGDTMVRYAERMLESWQSGVVRDVHAEMMALTLGIAAKTLFDADADEDVAEIGQAFDAVADEIATRIPRLFRIPDAVPTPGNIRYRRGVRRIDRLVTRIIQERRQQGGDRGDLLSMLAPQTRHPSLIAYERNIARPATMRCQEGHCCMRHFGAALIRLNRLLCPSARARDGPAWRMISEECPQSIAMTLIPAAKAARNLGRLPMSAPTRSAKGTAMPIDVDLPLIDHHCHGLVPRNLTRPEFEKLISESFVDAPAGTSHFDTPFGLAIRAHCPPLLDLEPFADPDQYIERRAALVVSIATINAWNRLMVAGGQPSGEWVEKVIQRTYQPA